MSSRERFTRREWLLGTLAAGLTPRQLAFAATTAAPLPLGKLAMPGLAPGRVVAVSHPACLVDGKFQAAPIAQAFRTGMLELTGAPDPTSAWRLFFERGDVVSIKVNPVGGPLVISCPEVLHEIIRGLESAGVRRNDIVVYDRYKTQFVFEHRTLYFATDPVALDHVGWKQIEIMRTKAGLKSIVAVAPDQFSTFVHGQPEHIEIAGALGLGVFKESKIVVRRRVLKA